MIPKVNRAEFTPDLLEDEEIYKARPEWMKWYYGAYILSTVNFDDDQHGWYMKLMMWSATEGDPPGYLPDDEDELKQIAGFKDLAAPISFLLKRGVEIPGHILAELAEVREKKWEKVRRKFVTHYQKPGLVFNRRLLKALKGAYNNLEQSREAGRLGAESRWGKREEESTLMAPAKGSSGPSTSQSNEAENTVKGKLREQRGLIASPMPTPIATVLAINYLSSSELNIHTNTSLGEGLSLTSGGELEEEELVLTIPNEKKEEVSSLGEREENQNSGVEEKLRISGKRKRSGETLFDESKWVVTVKMMAHLLTKYQSDGIEQEDVKYLGEKFALVHFNSFYSSWARAFYNFVDNQLTKYGYEFGMYKRRGKRNDQTRNGPRPQNEPPTIKPWANIESTADRNARLEQETDEYTRNLRSGGSGSHSQHTPGLSLTTDDSN